MSKTRKFRQLTAAALCAVMVMPGMAYAEEETEIATEAVTEEGLGVSGTEEMSLETPTAQDETPLDLTITAFMSGEELDDLGELISTGSIEILSGSENGAQLMNLLVKLGDSSLFTMFTQLEDSQLKLAFPDVTENVYVTDVAKLAETVAEEAQLNMNFTLAGEILPDDVDIETQAELFAEAMAPYFVKLTFFGTDAMTTQEGSIDLPYIGSVTEGTTTVIAPTGNQLADFIEEAAVMTETDTRLKEMLYGWADILDEMADINEQEAAEKAAEEEAAKAAEEAAEAEAAVEEENSEAAEAEAVTEAVTEAADSEAEADEAENTEDEEASDETDVTAAADDVAAAGEEAVAAVEEAASSISHEDADNLRMFTDNMSEILTEGAGYIRAVGDMEIFTLTIGTDENGLALLDLDIEAEAVAERISSYTPPEEDLTESDEEADAAETESETDDGLIELAVAEKETEEEQAEAVSLALAENDIEEAVEAVSEAVSEAVEEIEEAVTESALEETETTLGALDPEETETEEEDTAEQGRVLLHMESTADAYLTYVDFAGETILLEGIITDDETYRSGQNQLTYNGQLVMQSGYQLSREERTLIGSPSGYISVYLPGSECHYVAERTDAGDDHILEFLYNAGTLENGEASIYDVALKLNAKEGGDLQKVSGEEVDLDAMTGEERGQWFSNLLLDLLMHSVTAVE